MVEHYASSPRLAPLDPNSILYEEPSILLMQEVSKASRYNAVIDAIANGRTQSGEIATAIGSTTAETSYYLKELERIGLVTREQPLGERARGRSTDSATISSVSGFASSHRILPRSNVGCQDVLGRSIEKALSEYMVTGFRRYLQPVALAPDGKSRVGHRIR